MIDLIAVMSCANNKSKRDAIRVTWGKDSHVPVLFFVGDSEVANESDVVTLPCSDDYQSCSLKQFEMIRHVSEDCKSVFFCDDDTYLVTSRLAPINGQYVGCPCVMEDGSAMAHGGAGFLLGNYALKQATEDNHHLCNETNYSDQLVGKLMKKTGVTLTPDFRFNPGKYRGDVGYCNLVPNAKNKYITTHFVSEELMKSIHQQENRQNIYEMIFNGISVIILEQDGDWFCTPKVSTELFGPFELAQCAEDYALRNLGLPSTL